MSRKADIDLTPYIASTEETRRLVAKAFRDGFRVTDRDLKELEEWEKSHPLPE